MEFYTAIKNNQIMTFSGKINGTGENNVKQNKSDSERQISYIFFHIWNLELKKNECERGTI
jgi:hypothetical protein